MSPHDYQNLIAYLWEEAAKKGVSGLEPTTLQGADIGLSADQVNRLLPSLPYSILLLLTDIKERAAVESLSELSSPEKMFDLIMGQLDAAQPYRLAIKRLWSEIFWHPLVVSQITPYFWRHGGEILQKAGYTHNEWMDYPKIPIFYFLFSAVFTIWLDDDTLDQSKTMAALDDCCKKCESFFQYAL